MPPKKKGKRKRASDSNTNGDPEPAPLDRATWPGWVEMESEPAFFNVILSDMGVQGVRIQEVYGLDPEMLAILPQPVHALIFLFRYRDVDESSKGTECPDHVWFANQIPDFACATVALLNVVNNIKGLKMGKELRDFHDFTRDMDPMSRGDALADFDFVRQIHNSFGREIDFLNADQHWQQKVNKAKKKQALAKARETREAKKEAKKGTNEDVDKPAKDTTTSNGVSTPRRSSSRTHKKEPKSIDLVSNASSPLTDPPESDGNLETPERPTKAAPRTNDGRRRSGRQPKVLDTNPDADFEAPSKAKTSTPEPNGARRRSARQPKPRKKSLVASSKDPEEEDQEGFHFVAYMPIQGHVWRMDGLDKFPQDIGAFDDTPGGDWMSIAQTALQTRMALYEGADIEFNLMAVVHDSTFLQREELVRNMTTLQAVDKKLDEVFEDWRALDGGETGEDVLKTSSDALGISEADVIACILPDTFVEKLKGEDDLMRLTEMRKEIMRDQAPLRGAVRDGLEASNADEEKARHRRHDYGGFVRAWMGELAENGLLTGLMESVKQAEDDKLGK